VPIGPTRPVVETSVPARVRRPGAAEDTVSTLLQEWRSEPVFTGHDGTPLDSDSISLVGEWSEEVFNEVREVWFPEIEPTSVVARNLVTLGQMSIVREQVQHDKL
jgi:hypothetical protein